MVEVAEAVGDLVVVVPVDVELRYGVVNVVAQSDVLGCWSAALVLVGRYVRPESPHGAQAFPGYNAFGWTNKQTTFNFRLFYIKKKKEFN